jgi:hypothetical protein
MGSQLPLRASIGTMNHPLFGVPTPIRFLTEPASTDSGFESHGRHDLVLSCRFSHNLHACIGHGHPEFVGS